MNLALRVDEHGELRVRFDLSRDDAFAASVRLSSSDRFAIFDGGENWMIFEGRGFGRWLGATVALGLEPFLELDVVATFGGDDAFDHTRTPTEPSLDDLLAVAAAARIALGVGPARFPWANAVRVADDHRLEVAAIERDADAAVYGRRSA